MCRKRINLRETKEGQLTKCAIHNMYCLRFNNIMLEFTDKEFLGFQNYLKNIKVDYWEEKDSNDTLLRKIPIHTIQHNLLLMFTRYEIDSLKKLALVNQSDSDKFIKSKNINYNLIFN